MDGSDQGRGQGHVVPSSGDATVDEAMHRLAGVEDRDLRTQLDAFEDVHRSLQERLADSEG